MEDFVVSIRSEIEARGGPAASDLVRAWMQRRLARCASGAFRTTPEYACGSAPRAADAARRRSSSGTASPRTACCGRRTFACATLAMQRVRPDPGASWPHQAYLKASNADAVDVFGSETSLSAPWPWARSNKTAPVNRANNTIKAQNRSARELQHVVAYPKQ